VPAIRACQHPSPSVGAQSLPINWWQRKWCVAQRLGIAPRPWSSRHRCCCRVSAESRRSLPHRPLLFSTVFVALATAGWANAGVAVTFDGVLGLATEVPRVRAAAQALREQTELDQRLSGVPFNPQVAIQPGWRLAPNNARQSELILEILQPWSLSGYGSARRSAAVAEEDVLRAEIRSAALSAHLGAARTWIDLWAAERVVEDLRREEEIARELERLVDRAAGLGTMTRADLAEAAAYHAEARIAVLAAEGEVFQVGLALAKEVGDADAVPLRTAGGLPNAAVPGDLSMRHWLDRAGAAPIVVVRGLQAKAARAREVEHKAMRGTVVQVGAGVQRDAPDGLVISGIARITAPLFERGERERAGLRAEAARMEGERREALIASRVEIAAAFHEVSHTAEVLTVVRDDLVPASRLAAETRRRIFQEGGATLLEVLQSDRAAVAAARRLWRMQAEHAWARAKLWLLLVELGLRETPRGGGP